MAASPPAQADVTEITVSTTAPTATTTGACVSLPVTYYVAVSGTGVDDWGIDGDIISSAGASVDSVFEYEQAAVTQASNTYTLCGLVDGTNSFRLVATAEAYDWESTNDYKRTIYLDLPITITKTVYVPPPPAPVVTNCATSVSLHDTISESVKAGKKKATARL